MTVTVIEQNYDEWTEDALDYVVDQLRDHNTVGFDAGQWASTTIEKGEPPLQELVQYEGGDRSIWIVPGQDDPDRVGGTIVHNIRVNIQTAMSAAIQPLQKAMDQQEDFRRYSGKVYNAVLGMFETGRTAGHWDDWQPTGPWEPLGFDLGDRALLIRTLPMILTRDRIWLQGGG